jgi:hypothetical protein
MADKRVLINGLHLYLSPVLEGETFREGTVLSVNGKPLPDKWVEADWQAIEVGSRVEFTYHVCFGLSGVVAEFNWSQSGGEVPFIRLVEGCFDGSLKELERGSLGRYGAFQVLSYEEAWVEPKWLFQGGVSVSWSAYKSILEYLGEWTPFKPLSLAGIWQCVRYAADVYLEWSPENLLEALGRQGHFALPTELRKTHDALKLADAIKEHGWPLDDEGEEPQESQTEILNLWFDLDSRKWIWLRPNSLFEDRLGLSCVPFTRQELEGDVASIALKLLFPDREPFFTVKGQVFTSVSGPA